MQSVNISQLRVSLTDQKSLPTHQRRHRQIRSDDVVRPSAKMSTADVVAVGAGVFALAVTSVSWYMVSSRVTSTIETRNLRTRVDSRLKDLQLQLFSEGNTVEDVQKLKVKIVKLKLLLKKMEEDAKDGRAMQGRNQVPIVTPLTYLQKSMWSTTKDAKKERVFAFEGDLQEQLVAVVTLGVIFMLLTTRAFLP
mmetsp:Transcript_28817/g.39817  ORF Transcript_28817/g.39817 Transcript_28817/m.39817 type:complete len:194 (-) Transcript_28817:137-718(-)|eukprot:CAMPEP_0196590978 /NCGR_PEP_ID=MMETSP1081-20130531/68126_1 /TAXON_ID=36882 /ORGANISM="Pyramimonas amylifera, Strain CCMP720" /LENGTH=193 /DNA_ID=CAMNT_0041914219 /DNA_START=106 /DNA_END=687 /DNA_ORIENTATION=-